MAGGQRDIMTIREMIDAAILFQDCNPVVDFKMLESVFFIMARHLNVLKRQMKVVLTSRELKKPRKKMSVTEIKIHTKTGKKKKKDSKSKKSTSKKSGRRSRSSRRSAHRTTSEDSDDEPRVRKRGRSRSRSKSRSHSKKRKRRFSTAGDHDKSETDEDARKGASSRRKSKSRATAARQAQKKQTETDEDTRKGAGSRRKSDSMAQSKLKAGQVATTVRQAQKMKEKMGRKGKDRKYISSDEDDSEGLREKVLVAQEFRSVVTEDQFKTMMAKVRQLQETFGITDVVFGPKPQKLYLHKPTSLTDPRAALNIATRLDAAEKTLTNMLKVIKMYADKIGVDPDRLDLEDLEDLLLSESSSDRTSEMDATGSPGSPTAIQDTGAAYVEPVMDEEDFKEEGEIATWQQLTLGLTDFQKTFHRDLFNCATEVAETAAKAKKLLQESDRLMKEVLLINSKFVKVQMLSDQFVNKVTALDKQLTMQMSDCHECMLQTQYDLDSTLEKIEDICSHPQEDPIAVAAIKDDFASFLLQIAVARANQNFLVESHEVCAADMKIYWKKIAIIRDVKTVREEVTEALKDKASISDLNGLLSIEEFHAVTGYLQQEIVTTNEHIYAGEVIWQKIIHDLVVNLHDKATRDQVDTLTNSLNMVVRTMDDYLERVFDIVGPYPINVWKKKLDRDGNCLSCGTPANVELSYEYMGVVKRLASLPEEPTKKKKPPKKPCIPGLPIPHPLDPRSLVCKRFCGASIGQHEEIDEKKPFGMEILAIDPGHAVDVQSQIELTDDKVKVPCTPCNQKSEHTLYYFKS